jgi:crotonobetainyl-CoA:carnitine CoA-transferase CaiB-like acyl-CoA transferase
MGPLSKGDRVAGGLSGVRVVDFGHYIAGPMAAVLLADAGADVVHVDAPDAASSVGPTDALLNRNKRRLTLDLKTGADLAVARDLVQQADVLIENFRPGTMERLGLGSAEMTAANPRLVYSSFPAFGSSDARSATAGWEGILHAATAGYRPLQEHWDPTGRNRATVADRAAPLFTPITTASNFGALLGAFSIVTALIARARTGRGQRIELPLVEAMTEAYSTMLGHRVYEDTRMGDNLMVGDISWRCADDGIVDCSPYPKFVIPLVEAAGAAEEWQRRGLIDLGATTFDLDRRDEIQERFAALVRSHPAEWWDDVAVERQLPLAMVRTAEQWIATPQARQSGTIVRLVDPLLGPTMLPGAGFDLFGFPASPQPRHRFDADHDDVVAQLRDRRSAGSAAVAGQALTRPLDGFRAIDMTQAVAGPTAARLLADYGADVVKIGSPVPAVTDGIVGHLHRGKRTILMDTKSVEGIELLGHLVELSDAFITNFTASSSARYGIDYDSLRSINPELVYLSISAYGSTGPWATRRGYENQCNAATGMSSSYGSQFGWTLYQPSPINDAACGILGAIGVVVGLYARLQGGTGQKVTTSLAQASTWHQAVSLVRQVDADAPAETRTEYGRSARYRMYKAEDRWFFLAAPSGDVAHLARATGLDAGDAAWSTSAEPDGPLAQLLAARFLTEPAAHWEAALTLDRTAALTVATIDEAAAYLADRGVVYYEPGIEGDRVARPGIGAWLSETPPTIGANPGPVGSQAVEVLELLGLGADEIAALDDRNVVRLPHNLPTVEMWT